MFYPCFEICRGREYIKYSSFATKEQPSDSNDGFYSSSKINDEDLLRSKLDHNPIASTDNQPKITRKVRDFCPAYNSGLPEAHY